MDLEKLAHSLEYLLQAQKWNASVGLDVESSQITVIWKVLNKSHFKKLNSEFEWWAKKHQPAVWQNQTKDFLTGQTIFSFNEDDIFEDDETADEDTQKFVNEATAIFDEVMEHQTIHPLGNGIDLQTTVEASFEILQQVPLETSKVQFNTKTSFGQISVPLKFQKDSFFIRVKLPSGSKHTIEQISKKLWSDLDFAILFRRKKPLKIGKKYVDQKTISMGFQWESPSVLVMQLAEKIVQDAIKPYGLFIVGEIFG